MGCTKTLHIGITGTICILAMTFCNPIFPFPGSSGEKPDESFADPDAFISVRNSNFEVDGRTFRFAGTNAYYLPNYQKLNPGVVDRTLDAFQDAGINVVRMWAFYDGYDCGWSKNDATENVIQTAPGQYSEQALRDLDRVIAKGKQRGIRFVLVLLNYWDELGGICQYNTWAGASNPSQNMNFFINNSNTQKWFKDYISMLLNRVNTETGRAYKDDPAVFGWQIINEGRNPGQAPQVLRDWYRDIARYIKSIDSSHLVSTGEEGFDDASLGQWESGGFVHPNYSSQEYSNTYVLRADQGTSVVLNTAISEIDFVSAHWYPGDWGWRDGTDSERNRAMRAWLSDHQSIAEGRGKPFVLGEYGFHDSNWRPVPSLYNELWNHAEQIRLDGSFLWQFTISSGPKCREFGGNICWPDDASLYNNFKNHIQSVENK